MAKRNYPYWADNGKNKVAFDAALDQAIKWSPITEKQKSFDSGVQSACYIFETYVIKVSAWEGLSQSWQSEYGKRSFDCPVLKQGTEEVDGIKYHWQISPRISAPSGEQVEQLIETIHAAGYSHQDLGGKNWGYRTDQSGILANGKHVLIDYECAFKVKK